MKIPIRSLSVEVFIKKTCSVTKKKEMFLATFILLFVAISNVGIQKCVRNKNLHFKLQVKAIVVTSAFNFELTG
jgi:hypothetical protein